MKISDPGTVIVENITPQLDGGRYPIKRAVGQDLVVEADIFKEGHDVISALLKWRPVGDSTWLETPMESLVNDRWRGVLTVTAPGPWEMTIEAWGDTFKSWQEEIHKKFDGGIRDLQSESLEGAAFIQEAATRAVGTPDVDSLSAFATRLKTAAPEETNEIAASAELSGLMTVWADRSLSTDYHPLLPLWVDGERAVFAAWYEFFPRSAEGKPDSGSTFRDCLPRVDDAKAMGFNVIYFPPIHPIGESNRKGRNNSVTCQPGEPGRTLRDWKLSARCQWWRTQGCRAGTRHTGRLRMARRRDQEAGNGDRPRLCDQLLAGSSLRAGPSRMVLQAARWNHQIR